MQVDPRHRPRVGISKGPRHQINMYRQQDSQQTDYHGYGQKDLHPALKLNKKNRWSLLSGGVICYLTMFVGNTIPNRYICSRKQSSYHIMISRRNIRIKVMQTLYT